MHIEIGLLHDRFSFIYRHRRERIVTKCYPVVVNVAIDLGFEGILAIKRVVRKRKARDLQCVVIANDHALHSCEIGLRRIDEPILQISDSC